MPKIEVTRRDFMKTSATAAVGITAALSPASNILGANDRINVGVIGCGGMGRSNMRHFMENKDVSIISVCDVYEKHLEKAAKMVEKKVKKYKDFRKLLENKDIDAVIVATPDHWHALPTIYACEAGKDVYVEKPLSLTIAEGRAMVNAARRFNRIVQMGTQQRSGEHFQRAVEIVKSGQLGKISFVRCWNYGNDYPEGIGNPPDSDPPEGLDWDFWLGPAPYVSYNPNRCIYQFRWFWDYSGGKLTDWGTHLLDIVVWAMDVKGPTAVSAHGGKFYLQDNRETPDTLEVTYEFPGFLCEYSSRECNSFGISDRGYGIQFHGTNGTLFVDRGGYEVYPEFERKEQQYVERTDMIRSGGSRQNEPHVRNFLDCMKSRELPVCDVEVGHRSTSVPHLGNIALKSKTRIEWDPDTEHVTNCEHADKMVDKPYRAPWKLPQF
ncbi:Gfo/Idh/MocA family oxidoreductase [candidate division KSB1 bacterium]|nr:Gfo/Idh/MocA family oxidoreductase [candidate division KSB1 bacterium]